MRWVSASLLCGALSTTALAAEAQLPWELAAAGGSDSLQGMLAVADLRQLDQQMRHLALRLRGLPAGAALLSPPAPKGTGPAASPAVADADGEGLRALLELAAPGGGAVPAAALLVAGPRGLDARLALQVQPGFLARCAEAPAAAYQVSRRVPAAGQAAPTGAVPLRLATRDGSAAYVGLLFGDRTLVLAGEEALLPNSLDHRPQGLPSARLEAELAGSQSALWLRGDKVWQRACAALGDGSLRAGLAQMEGLALAMRSSADGSILLRLLAEAPWMTALGQALAPHPSAADSLLPAVPAATFGYASCQSNELLRRLGKAYLAAVQRPWQLPQVRTYGEVLDHATGRLGALHFAAPGDWAVALQLDSPQAARQALTLAQELAAAALPRLLGGAVVEREAPACVGPQGPVLHLRPAQAVDGPQLVALHDTLWLAADRGRLCQLAAQAKPWAPAMPAPKDGVLRLMTPLLRDTLTADSLLSGYAVLRGDGAWLDQVQWLAAGLLAPPAAAAPAPGAGTQSWQRAMPQLLDVLAALYLQTYDLAWSVGLRDDLMEVTWATSQL